MASKVLLHVDADELSTLYSALRMRERNLLTLLKQCEGERRMDRKHVIAAARNAVNRTALLRERVASHLNKLGATT